MGNCAFVTNDPWDIRIWSAKNSTGQTGAVPMQNDKVLLPSEWLTKLTYPLFRIRDDLVQHPGYNTKYHNGGHHHGHGKGLGPIGNQITKSGLGGQELADDDAHQAQPDVHLHIAYNKGKGTGQQNLQEHILSSASQGVNQLDLFRIHLGKACV